MQVVGEVSQHEALEVGVDVSQVELLGLHVEKGKQHLQHTLAIGHVQLQAVELDDSLHVSVEVRLVSQVVRAGNVLVHGSLVLGLSQRLSDPEVPDVCLYFGTRQDLLQVLEGAVLERDVFVLKKAFEALAQMAVCKIIARLVFLNRSHNHKRLLLALHWTLGRGRCGFRAP